MLEMTSNWDLHQALFRKNFGEIVRWAMYGKVRWAVDGVLLWTVEEAVRVDVTGAVNRSVFGTTVGDDPKHPALQDFLGNYEPSRVGV